MKEILIGDDVITLRHSIPIPASPTDAGPTDSTPSGGSLAPSRGRGTAAERTSYLLRTGSDHRALWRTDRRCGRYTVFHHSGFEPSPYQTEKSPITNAMFDEAYQPFMVNRIKGKHDTLPISRIFRKRCALSAMGTHLKATSL